VENKQLWGAHSQGRKQMVFRAEVGESNVGNFLDRLLETTDSVRSLVQGYIDGLSLAGMLVRYRAQPATDLAVKCIAQGIAAEVVAKINTVRDASAKGRKAGQEDPAKVAEEEGQRKAKEAEYRRLWCILCPEIVAKANEAEFGRIVLDVKEIDLVSAIRERNNTH
jgi:hypothetical protein